MATTEEKASLLCCQSTPPPSSASSASARQPPREASTIQRKAAEWDVAGGGDPQGKLASALSSMISPIVEPRPSETAPKGSAIQTMVRAQTSHPLDPLSAAEISVAVSTVRAAGATAEVRDSMQFVEVVLYEPDKSIVALADACFFPPFQPSLLPRSKGGPVIPMKLPPRRARLVVYNKKSNVTSIWIVELAEVHAATRGGHHRGKVISYKVVPDVQPPMVFVKCT